VRDVNLFEDRLALGETLRGDDERCEQKNNFASGTERRFFRNGSGDQFLQGYACE